jgi:hypothetical protein
MVDSDKTKLNILVYKKSNISKEILKVFESLKLNIITLECNNELESVFKSLNILVITEEINNDSIHIIKNLRSKNKTCFIIVFNKSASENPLQRIELFYLDVNMVTCNISSIEFVIKQIIKIKKNKGNLICPICEEHSLSEDSLWLHLPLYHINYEQNKKLTCPTCI